MKYTIQLDVPRCPKCASLMLVRAHSSDCMHVVCTYCKSPYRVLSNYKADKELIITDNMNDVVEV